MQDNNKNIFISHFKRNGQKDVLDGKAGLRVVKQTSALQDFSLFFKSHHPSHSWGIISKILINGWIGIKSVISFRLL